MQTTFILREEHVKLLRASHVDWNDAMNGAATVDPKRPYGNSGSAQCARDIATIIGAPQPSEEDFEQDRADEFIRAMFVLHRETEQALQVVLSAGSFEPGTYAEELSGGRYVWRRVEHPTD